MSRAVSVSNKGVAGSSVNRNVAASLVPVMVTVMLLVVPSAALTANVSVALAPSINWFCSEEAV